MTLFLAILAPWAAQAQETLTVNDGTTTNEYVPVYGYWADNKQQSEFIIPSASLTEMAGSTLQAMKFYANYDFTSTGTFQVYLREVENSTFSNTTFYGTEGATTVYTGTITVSSTDGMTITFANDGYVYNGGNLLIGFLSSKWWKLFFEWSQILWNKRRWSFYFNV